MCSGSIASHFVEASIGTSFVETSMVNIPAHLLTMTSCKYLLLIGVGKARVVFLDFR